MTPSGLGHARYRAARPQVLRIEPLDEVLTAVFHRASGITHLLAEPAPEILAILADDWMTEPQVLGRLADRFDLTDADPAANPTALSARLTELVKAGLVEAVAA